MAIAPRRQGPAIDARLENLRATVALVRFYAPRILAGARGLARAGLVALLAVAAIGGGPVMRPVANAEEESPPDARPVPRMQVEPQPYGQASVQREGLEIARYHYGETLRRPFVFPLNGPAGRSVTRMGHPRDPNGHSHHNSFWVSHHDVDGVDFWGDQGAGRIVHQRVLEFEDEESEARIAAANVWVDGAGKPLLKEERRMRFVPLDDRHWLLVLDLKLTAVEKPRTLGKTPFGLVGVRMAKTIGVKDGGGRIRNSAGGINEAGVFWKPAEWVDYSGPIQAAAGDRPAGRAGATLMDHPRNAGHPNHFHVRDDGWMGVSTTFSEARTIPLDAPLSVRYGLLIHEGAPSVDELKRRFDEFVRLAP